ncbi:MAG: hypothetical protein D6723_16495 [Acidobacteria bacterium]|nr:MAG: hypothetical protein D6723_16495 [Acidobacteriota bacterium]
MTKAQRARTKTRELTLVPRVETRMRDVEKEIRKLTERVAEFTTKSIYFSLGTAILLKEGWEEFFDKALKKGEASEKYVVKRITSTFKRERRAKRTETTIETQIERAIHKVLDAFDIPSKSDIDKLNRRVAELSNRVAKLAQAQKTNA